MKSMTGYAYEESAEENYNLSVEIKSVNSRFLDLNINMPFFMSRLENRFKDKITNAILRGKVDIYLKIKEINQAMNVEVNTEAAISYAKAFNEVAKAIGDKTEVPLSLVIQQEGVILYQKEVDIEYYWSIFEKPFEKALSDFIIDREREGEVLKNDLLKNLSVIEKNYKIICEWQPKMENIFKENILNRFNEMLGDNVDINRVMSETASLLVKYTINEEIVRLNSHINALKKEIETNVAPGRKIDFICQEMNREINTIGSKNQLVEVGEAVIATKEALENLREQARNIE